MDRYETFATWIFIAFGVLVLAGLMAFSITSNDQPAFLFALGASCTGFFLGFAVVFNQPKLYGLILLATIVLVGCSIAAIVT
ncbi:MULTISPECIES: hypothetical protein [Phyllobacterium]|jgi:hypothetical protein|uniref:hypothetical protein n=1 Tax=Phyllobacterium TaxID=28100 RepID=UPI001AC1D690|nr:hypothetical protein [Phyllobacterium calauticae]MBN9136659.1 hypothetical protein [Phyllobacterium sp.]MBQ9352156.1 hypothetical protein [Phyllobacterium sp.]MBZ3693202.1 hypothetical protein [Phyllobacterium calauticae]|eukprot:gene6921-biopygen1619